MIPIKRFLSAVHRRGLWQVAGVYLAGSWGVLQVVDVLTDSLALPRGIPALAILLILIGLPVVIATALLQGGVPFRKLLGEIHRRYVWQVVGVYLAGAWVILELMDILVDSLDWPGWLPALAILLMLAGLPVVAAISLFRGGEDRVRSVGVGSVKGGRPISVEAGLPMPSEDPPIARRLLTWRNAVNGGVLAFALWGVIASGWMLLEGKTRPRGSDLDPGLDEDLVAVFPFRVTGAEGLAFLSEGMVDLLAAKLTGEGGPRAADPRSVLSAWSRAAPEHAGEVRREVAIGLGRSLGAGQILLGGIVGTPSGLVLNASVYDVRDGEGRAQVSVQGPADSLSILVDRLTANILALEAGERDQRLGDLTSQSLPALRAYLHGQAAYRRGGYGEANAQFERALEMDSTFALAALAWVSSSWWSPGFEKFNRAMRVAWDLRRRLSLRDRTLLEAWAGPRYPEVSPWAEHLPLWELAIAEAPERPEPWYESGDVIFHYGRLLGIPDSRERARARFHQASELDSAFAAPVGHLLELAALRNDTAEVRSLAVTYRVLDPAGETSDFLQWRAASALADDEALAGIHQRFPRMAPTSLNRIIGVSQLYGPTLDEALLAASDLAGRAGTTVERREWLLGLHSLALNRGRPQEARRLLEEWSEVEGTPRESLRIQVLDALFWDGDAEAARRALSVLERQMTAPLAEVGELREAQLADICVAELWRLRHGDGRTARRSLDGFLRQPPGNGPQSIPPSRAVCVAAVEALLAAAEGRPDAPDAFDRLDSQLLLGPPIETTSDVSLIGTFLVAEWRETQGDLEGALATLRRWHDHWFSGVCYLSSYLREEGRLAAMLGDREGAMQAYRHYLALRSDPELELSRLVESVQAQMEILTTDRGP